MRQLPLADPGVPDERDEAAAAFRPPMNMFVIPGRHEKILSINQFSAIRFANGLGGAESEIANVTTDDRHCPRVRT